MTYDASEEIHGFAAPDEFRRFVDFVEGKVRSGQWSEIPPDPDYGPGEIYGGRWFQNQSGAIWRLVEPDFPFKGLWEPVRIEQPAVTH
jgi:hypothetical protein